jgi:hypothetical protein
MNLSLAVERERAKNGWFREAPRYARLRREAKARASRNGHRDEGFRPTASACIEYLLTPEQLRVLRMMATDPWRNWSYGELGLTPETAKKIKRLAERSKNLDMDFFTGRNRCMRLTPRGRAAAEKVIGQ